MEFKNLEIERAGWGDKKGCLKGRIRFGNDKGNIVLNLNQSHIDRIFEVVADTMIDTAKEAAQELTANIIEHKNLIK
ncbi:MAG: hypothetical protein K0U08_01525 [Proteobacteria bacterium]|nr:hypothetical protein [Pseudomonadota bacterium]